MKKLLYGLALIVLMSSQVFSAFAADKFSCSDLTDIANDLDDISAGFAAAGNIEEGSELDKALGTVVDSLTLIAEVENEASLNNAVDSLITAYNNFDGEKFQLAIDSVAANLDRLYRRDCNS